MKRWALLVAGFESKNVVWYENRSVVVRVGDFRPRRDFAAFSDAL